MAKEKKGCAAGISSSEVWGRRSRSAHHEQTVLDKMIKSDKNLLNHIKIFPAEDFNSIYLMDLNKIDNNFIVHLMARSSEIRINKMKKYIQKNNIS